MDEKKCGNETRIWSLKEEGGKGALRGDRGLKRKKEEERKLYAGHGGAACS